MALKTEYLLVARAGAYADRDITFSREHASRSRASADAKSAGAEIHAYVSQQVFDRLV